MREQFLRVASRVRYAAIGAAVGAAIGALFGRNAASTGGAIGGLAGAVFGEKRVEARSVVDQLRERGSERIELARA